MHPDDVEPTEHGVPGDGEALAAPGRPETQATGVPAVDEVLASLDGLAERPVDEHVEVFERAHERLRRALEAPGRAEDA